MLYWLLMVCGVLKSSKDVGIMLNEMETIPKAGVRTRRLPAGPRVGQTSFGTETRDLYSNYQRTRRPPAGPRVGHCTPRAATPRARLRSSSKATAMKRRLSSSVMPAASAGSECQIRPSSSVMPAIGWNL